MRRKIKTAVRLVAMAVAICLLMTLVSVVERAERSRWEQESSAPSRLERRDKKAPVRVLLVGNSYSVDSSQYVYEITQQAGYTNVTVGTAYYNGCSLDDIYEWGRNRDRVLSYRKCTQGKWQYYREDKQNCALRTVLRDEKWDIILLQQYSVKAGKKESFYSEDGKVCYIDGVANYIRQFCPKAMIGWNMTWALKSDATLQPYLEWFEQDQMKMYQAICQTTQEVVTTNPNIGVVVPTGTAIQNARTYYLGDTLNRDQRHLTFDLGRYLASLTVAESLGFDLTDLKELKTNPPSDNENLEYLKDCARDAVEHPYELTTR